MNSTESLRMIDVATARRRVASAFASRVLPGERVALDAALGRVLAAPVAAPGDIPGFAHAAMDGYAVRGADLSADAATRLELVGVALAGAALPPMLGPGQCVRIATGAAMPTGADTVVIKENASAEGDHVVLAAGTVVGANVRAADDDYAAAQPALAAGLRLGSGHVGVLAAFGFDVIEVRRRPRVAVLVSGDELVQPGAASRPGQRYDSNGPMLEALLREHGADPVARRHERDDRARLADALRELAAAADLVITTGGVSAGEADHLPGLVSEHGAIDFWKLRMRPGKPALFGRIATTPLFALPGNAVSVYATFCVLVRPALAALCACPALDPAPWHARLAGALRKAHERTEFRRARLVPEPSGTLTVQAHAALSSGALRSVAESDALIELEAAQREFAAGTIVPVHRFALDAP
jgi:molybdopterin molybdotransferase